MSPAPACDRASPLSNPHSPVRRSFASTYGAPEAALQPEVLGLADI